MFSPFSCGNFSQVDDDDEPVSGSPYSTPKKSRSRRSTGLLHRSNSRDIKNPYANVGLEKFAAVMAELEEKRQQIYAQTGSQEETLVHFVYKKPDDSVPVPIVVILKDKKDDKTKSGGNSPHRDHEKHVVSTTRTTETSLCNKFQTIQEVKQPVTVSDKLITKKRMYKKSWEMSMPSFYLPVAVIFILVLLAVFGRSIAILCTSIGWYAVPALKAYQSSSTSPRSKTTKKKDIIRRLSDKKMVADQGLLSSPRY